MGNRISASNGVRSPNFHEPGNAVNEVWVGKLEVISRLPFGDSDMAQAGWAKGDYPKIPWRPFIIALRASFSKAAISVSTAIRDSASPTVPKDIEKAFAYALVAGDMNFCVMLRFASIPAMAVTIIVHFAPQLIHRKLAYPPDQSDCELGYATTSPETAEMLRQLIALAFHIVGTVLFSLELGVKLIRGENVTKNTFGA